MDVLIVLSVYLALGVVAGILAGLLGVGGGLVLVAALVWVLPGQGVPVEAVMHTALATSLASILVTGLSSARSHHRRGSVAWRSVAWLVPGLLLGAGLGGMLAVHVDGAVLRWGFSGYCFVAAAQLAFGQTRARPGEAGDPRGPGLTLAGVGIGGVSSLVGIGGGSMAVPLLIWLGSPPVRAVGSSSACGVFIAAAAALAYAGLGPDRGMPAGSIGYVFLPAALGVALASVATAPLGVRLAHRIDGRRLRRVFAITLALVGVALLF